MPLVPPLLLPPLLLPPELLPPELLPPELLPPLLDDVSPQKNDFFARAHAFVVFAQTPSMHAAARYESPLVSQSQHVGLQSANVEHAAPGERVPFSFCGIDGQPPFTCSACEETSDEDDPEEDDEEEEEEEEEEPDGEFGSELPVMSDPLLPPEHATRAKSEDEATSQPNFMRRAQQRPYRPRMRGIHAGRATRRATLAQTIAPDLTRQRRAMRRRA